MGNRYGSLDSVFVLEQANSYDLRNTDLRIQQGKICLISDSVEVNDMKSQKTN